MKVLFLFPPNYREVNAAFKIRGRSVIFAWGDTIYNPCRVKIPPELIAHEAIHGARQGGDPAAWWRRYIDDPAFRLDEEIPAHRAELLAGGDIDQIVDRLASPLYGSMVSRDRARALVQG